VLVFCRHGILLALVASANGVAGAQEDAARRGLVLGAGLGYGSANLTVTEQSNSESGLIGHGRIGMALSPRTALLLDVQLNPFKVASPILAEEFWSVDALVSLQVYSARGGGGFYLQPGLGLQHRRWSGPERVNPAETGLALGLAAGYELRLGHQLALAPEALWRWALIEVEGSVTTRFLGLRLIVSPLF
jgi:hypothetical protein